MIRIYLYDDSGAYKDFENYLFSTHRAVFDFPSDKLRIDQVDYRISTINQLPCQGSSTVTPITPPLEFPFTSEDLTPDHELIKVHNLDTNIPQVIVIDNTGVVIGEGSIQIKREDTNTIRLSFFGPIQGIWHCKIIK